MAKKRRKKVKRFQKNWKKQMDDCLELFDSLLIDNDIDSAKYYIVNVVMALFIGYKIPPFDLQPMYNIVKLTKIKLNQPEIVLSEQSKKLLTNLANNYDWSEITPMFVSTLGENMLTTKERREGGMHYTSVVNIHKVIDPLFLDELTAEVEEVEKSQNVDDAKALQKKLGSLKFLDPACGNGNFLIESYISLRELENRLIKIIYEDGREKTG